ETIAAILLEPVTGYSGIVPAPDGYLQRLRELCDRHGILLIFDEVIDGFCRTGKWFASEHWGVEPDIMTVAKGITSGYVPQRVEVRNAEMTEVAKAVWAEGSRPAFRWNLVIIAPPLTISEEELGEGLDAIEAGLEVADRHVAAAV